MEYDKMAQGQVTSLGVGGVTPVVLPFVPTYVELFNPTRATAAAGVTHAWWEIEMGSGAAMLTTTAAGPVDGTSYIAAATGTGITPFIAYASNLYGANIALTSIVTGNPTQVTANAHGFVTGDVVLFQNVATTATTGFQSICNIPWVVTRTGANTFTIALDSTTGAAFFTNTGAVGTVKKILYPFLYAPGSSDIQAITLGATTVVTTTAPHNFVVGQEVAFRIPAAFGTTQLNPIPLSMVPGTPQGTGYVTVVNNATQVTVNINSLAFTAFAWPTTATIVAGGIAPPQIVAVGDNNSGSNQFGYLSPLVNGTHTINGPAIAGAYVNNTSMGFLIGTGVSGTANDTIIWRAEFASTL